MSHVEFAPIPPPKEPGASPFQDPPRRPRPAWSPLVPAPDRGVEAPRETPSGPSPDRPRRRSRRDAAPRPRRRRSAAGFVTGALAGISLMLLLALVGVATGELALGGAASPGAALGEALERQYFLAYRYGSDLDQCVRAQTVAAAYLEAGDDQGYALWSGTARDDCARAAEPGS